MIASDLLTARDGGLWCEAGRFHVDPGRAVERAIVTHAHSDHCRPGHGSVMATPETIALARARLGPRFSATAQPLACHRPLAIGDVTVTLVPAGHVLGSAQVVIEAGGVRAVVSGDYKRRPDPSCRPFEVVPCDLFVTEATFGLPVYRHPDTAGEIERLLGSLARFPERTHLIGAYSLGKAQRLIAQLRQAGYERPLWMSPTLLEVSAVYEAFGIRLGPLRDLDDAAPGDLAGEIVLAPPGAAASRWADGCVEPLIVGASGWMRVRRTARSRGTELALVISDHADWDELTTTIPETGAGEVWVTHGAEDALIHWCRARGIHARPLRLPAGDDED